MKTRFLQPKYSLLLIVLLAFVVRLYAFTEPLGDWHSWRQADTSAVSRNFVTRGYDILHPRFDDLSNVPSKLDNPNGYRFVEFPIYNLVQAGLYQSIGILSIEEWGRLVSILATLCSIYLLYALVRRHAGEQAGLLTAFFYAFFPFTIYYGRTILPDTSMVTAILAGTYFFDLWFDERSKKKKQATWLTRSTLFFWLSLLLTTIAFLLKPYALFFTLPMVYIAYRNLGWRIILERQLWIFLIFSLTPLLLWRQWMMQYPEGIPSNTWLLNGNGIRFRPAFFRWMIFERTIKLISGYAGVVLLILGSFQVFREKERGFFLAFLISSLAYVCVFASGNVQHDYYQILIMPTIAVIYGLGAKAILTYANKHHAAFGIVLVALITFIAFLFSWNIVKDYFNINNRDMIAAGKVVDMITPKDAKVVALYDGDTSFLYQTKRQGWANMQDPLPVLVKKGADYLVLLHPSPNDIAYYTHDYPTVVASSSSYMVIQLK